MQWTASSFQVIEKLIITSIITVLMCLYLYSMGYGKTRYILPDTTDVNYLALPVVYAISAVVKFKK